MFSVKKGTAYPVAKMRKNRAIKGRELERQEPGSLLQSASSFPAWRGDMHSKGCSGQPCASGVYILTLGGRKEEPRRGCWRLDKSSNPMRSIPTKRLKIQILMVDTAQIWMEYSFMRAACFCGSSWGRANIPRVSLSLPFSSRFSVAPLVLPG